ncbi:riboflavin synthase [Timonella sp. A28]|uniref:riboflavin synthase n=1 Tax=Timonella sp. A28 TaxID=3442640 RepID=UPI003EB871F5
MFTGIVEEVGTIVELEEPPATGNPTDTISMRIAAPEATSTAQLGDSIAINGVCLTVAELPGNGTFTADLMPETLKRTALNTLKAGSRVNIERAMPAHGRLDGHIVQGHVDGIAQLAKRVDGERWSDLTFNLPSELSRYVVEKGSIAVSGTSLTVTKVGDDWFSVSLIPTTLALTILGDLNVGDLVNIEVDVIAKYVERLVSRPE